MNTVSLGFKFGGQVYNFTGIDLILDDVSTTPGLKGMCLSAIFVLGSILDNQIIGAGGPAWLVGDAFLKNVYSVFRSVDLPFVHPRLFNPGPRFENSLTGAISGSVGFARLSGVDGRLTTNGATYSAATSAPSANIPATSGIPNTIAPLPDPLANNGTLNSNVNGAASRWRLRRSEYSVVLIGVSSLLSLV